jgi:hypothetical protein
LSIEYDAGEPRKGGMILRVRIPAHRGNKKAPDDAGAFELLI